MPRRRIARPAVLAAALALVLTLAGCGHVSAVDPGRALRVGLTEYRLIPQDVHAHAGELSILVHNYGQLTHNLAVRSGPHTVADTKPIAPGAGAVLLVELTPGSYTLVSTLFSDQDLGLYGTLTVTR